MLGLPITTFFCLEAEVYEIYKYRNMSRCNIKLQSL